MEEGNNMKFEKVVGYEQVKMETQDQKSIYEREDPESEMEGCK